ANYGPTPIYTPTASTAFDINTNRLANNTYDPAGNLHIDIASRTFEYDAENRQTVYNVGNSALNATYGYDGDGRRIRKTQDAITTVYVYDIAGRLAAEHVSQPFSATGTQYLTGDALGSIRVTTDGSGNVVARHDYLPFGDEIASSLGRSGIPGYGNQD